MNVEINKPLENPRLKELFARRRAAEDGEALRPVMEKLLSEVVLNARFLSVVRLSSAPEAEESGRAVFYPVFIDREELGKWDPLPEEGLKTLALGFDEYAYMVLDKNEGDGLVINPFSDNLSLDRGSLRELRERKELRMEGHARKQVEEDAVVQLGEPDVYPEEMVEAIRRSGSGREAAVAADDGAKRGAQLPACGGLRRRARTAV